MISSWKTRFQSLVTDTSAEAKPDGAAGEESVSHLHRMLADLRRSHGVPEVPDVQLDMPAAVDGDVAPATDDAFETAHQFVEEHRETVESLLHELGTLDAYLKSHAKVTAAFDELAAAKQRATEAANEEQRTKTFAEESAKHRDASKRERESADDLVAYAHTEFQSANDEIAELERRLSEAVQRAEGKAAALKECEARAEECAADESAAAVEAAEAMEQHKACQDARAAAEKDYKAAADLADALKKEAGLQSVTAIGNVQRLALKIAGGAAALNGSANQI